MNNKGFTLTELLATITILGIVMTIGTVTYVSIQKNIRNEQTMDTFTTILNAAKTNFDMGVLDLEKNDDGYYETIVSSIPDLSLNDVNFESKFSNLMVTIILKGKNSIACFREEKLELYKEELNNLFDDKKYYKWDDKTGKFFEKYYCTTTVEAIENVELPDPEINTWQNVHN